MSMVGNYGFIHEKLDIKILILYVLRLMNDAIDIGVLTEIAMCDDGINYFDFVECVQDLEKTEHIKIEDGLYSLTPKGRRNCEFTEGSLPYTVRTIVENAVFKQRSIKFRNSLIKTSRSEMDDGGFTVFLSLSDGISEIATMGLYAADLSQAKDIELGFRRNAEKVYNELINTILQ
ncbi:MAG: DUF4364 family protein [Oscillospiraceae bacterium]|nr:DUF4364 family protein [Oscillospiraceae bacterium]